MASDQTRPDQQEWNGLQFPALLPHNGSIACNPAGVTPRVFLSYSHDSEAHRAWVRLLAERLRLGGVEVTLDQWDLPYGADVVRFMDLGIRDADRVLMVCTANYVAKAEERKGGAGYEGMIVTGHVARASGWISATMGCSRSDWRSCCGSCRGAALPQAALGARSVCGA
ncbi:MAG: toll/interleukin-1 receptor domain-containing protein [Cyanobacteriota bacterium]|nr:toll/interleukin-1 receptor domain-containing protein [Cyanobacteriota bacterium]